MSLPFTISCFLIQRVAEDKIIGQELSIVFKALIQDLNCFGAMRKSIIIYRCKSDIQTLMFNI